MRYTNKEILNTWKDKDGFEFEYKCLVVVAENRMIESAKVEWIQAYTPEGEYIEQPSITTSLINNIEEHAGRLALERLSDSDFIDTDKRHDK